MRQRRRQHCQKAQSRKGRLLTFPADPPAEDISIAPPNPHDQ